MNNKRFIYYPAFSSLNNHFRKNIIKIGNLNSIRFYEESFLKEFHHPYYLLTAGTLYKTKRNIIEDLGLHTSSIIADSGGFQIANGTLKYSKDLLQKIFTFLNENSTIAPVLDIPPKLKYEGKFNDCLEISKQNFRFFADQQNKTNSKTKYLNILQTAGEDESALKWYNEVKEFKFNGWAVGGTMRQYYNAIYATALFLQHKEFENPDCQYLHFFGTTNPFSLFVYAMIQKNLNIHFPHIQVSTDSSTPARQPNFGNLLQDMSTQDLVFKYHKFQESTKHRSDLNVPCNLIGCPVCSNTTLKELMNDTKKSQRNPLLALHGLFMFNNYIRWISDVVNAETTQGLVDDTMHTIARSIDEMFLNPDIALRVYENHKGYYRSMSNRIKTADARKDHISIGPALNM